MTTRRFILLGAALMSAFVASAQTTAAPAAANPPKAPAAIRPAPVSKELQAQIELVLHKEAEAEQKLRAIYDLLMGPISSAKNELLSRACEEGGIPPVNGAPSCELDTRAWIVRPAKTPEAPRK